MNDNKCYGCDKRHIGCHSECKDYREFRINLDKKKESIQEKLRGFYQLRAFKYDNTIRPKHRPEMSYMAIHNNGRNMK